MSNATTDPALIPEAGGEPTFSDLIGILRKHLRTVLATIAIITIPSALYAVWRDPGYTARTLVVVDPSANLAGTPAAAPGTAIDPSLMQTQVNIVLGNPLANQTLDSLGLLKDPEFQASGGLLSGLLGSSSSAGVDAADAARRAALDIFARNLGVRNPSNSRVLEVSYTSADPAKAAAIANGISNFYVAYLLDRKNADLVAWRERIARSLEAQKRLVIDAEGKVAELRAKGQVMSGRSATLAESDMEELNKLLIQSRAEEAKLRSKLTAIDQLKASGGPADSINEVLASQVVSQLRMQELDLTRQIAENSAIYSDSNPRNVVLKGYLGDVRQRITQEVGRIVTGMRNDLAAVAAQSAALDQQLKGAIDQNGRAGLDSVQLQEAERDAMAKRTVYEDLLHSEQQAGVMLGSTDAGAWIMSPAEVPTKPSTLGVLSIAAVAAVLSALLGGAIGLAREYLDKRLLGTRQVEDALQVPCLALLPKPDSMAGQSRQLSALGHQANSVYGHAVRALGAQLAVISPKAKTIMVTSPLPSREKTRLAVDLAVCSAQDGKRTVLVNFDRYQPLLMQDFGLQVPAEAHKLLTSSLNSDHTLDQALILDQGTGLDILPLDGQAPADSQTPAPQNMVALIKMLGKRYKAIVINAPPLLGVSDSHLLAGQADTILMVLDWEKTERSDAVAGAGLLKRLTTGFVGAVMTGVDAGRQLTQTAGLLTQQRFRKLYEA